MWKFLSRAQKKACQSQCRYKISAIGLDKSGNVVATATNFPRFDREGGSVHAEMAVLRKGGSRVRTILICRVGNNGDLLEIEPCETCKSTLDRLGIKVYSLSNS